MANRQYILPVASTSGSGGGGAPSGPAGGVLSGTYPNPGFATSPTFTGTVTLPNAITLPGTTTFTPPAATNMVWLNGSSTDNAWTIESPDAFSGFASIVFSGGGGGITLNASGNSDEIILNGHGAGILMSDTVTFGTSITDHASSTGGAHCVLTAGAAGGSVVWDTAGVSVGPLTPTSMTTVKGLVTAFTGTSDARLKDYVPYTGGLNEILAITPAKYTWNNKGQKHTGISGNQEFVGFIAQDVQKAIPEAITAEEPSKDGTEKYLALDDRPVIAALVNAVKQLSARISELEAKL